jgi:hypothetical protein
MVTLEFHDPSGALEVSVPFAARLATLEGKRIGIITNDQWLIGTEETAAAVKKSGVDAVIVGNAS